VAKYFVCDGTTALGASLVPAGQFPVCQSGKGSWQEVPKVDFTDLGNLVIIFFVIYALLAGYTHGRNQRF